MSVLKVDRQVFTLEHRNNFQLRYQTVMHSSNKINLFEEEVNRDSLGLRKIVVVP